MTDLTGDFRTQALMLRIEHMISGWDPRGKSAVHRQEYQQLMTPEGWRFTGPGETPRRVFHPAVIETAAQLPDDNIVLVRPKDAVER